MPSARNSASGHEARLPGATQTTGPCLVTITRRFHPARCSGAGVIQSAGCSWLFGSVLSALRAPGGGGGGGVGLLRVAVAWLVALLWISGLAVVSVCLSNQLLSAKDIRIGSSHKSQLIRSTNNGLDPEISDSNAIAIKVRLTLARASPAPLSYNRDREESKRTLCDNPRSIDKVTPNI